ncbi:CehA/McbA family metallohydrolase [Natronincola ferrireducens]|uniref:DUF3604 domain-containing protein n=1 Tax=Natronincola ferrireducens TaxID=393762 RepID=A0A1G9A9P1_9FIRM|nr:CehA/McbA family metallohydrolase [Natronincola ferrireducens]SDK23170.1 Protein of unknown function [Natronincola ferrireducens]
MIKIDKISEIATLTDIHTSSSQYPDIAITSNDDIFITWQSYEDGKDVIRVRKDNRKNILTSGVVEGDIVSTEGQPLKPRITIYNNTAWLTWAEYIDNKWNIMVSNYSMNQWTEAISISDGEGELYPVLAKGAGNDLWLFWTSQEGSKSYILAKRYDGSEWSQTIKVSCNGKAYRPEAVVGGDGNLWVAYDEFNGKNYDVKCKYWDGYKFSEEIIISESDDWSTAPSLTPFGDGIVINWYDMGGSATFSYWTAEVFLKDTSIVKENVCKLCGAMDWYTTLDLATDKYGKVVFPYTWGQRRMHIRIKDNNNKWSDPVCFTPTERNFEIRPKCQVDSDNNLWVVWQNSEGNGHNQRNAKIVVRALEIDTIHELSDRTSEMHQDQFVLPISSEKSLDCHSKKEELSWRSKEETFSKYNIYWGDIHGQSSMSDGLGEIDQYYHIAKHKANLDFTALTDHDCFPDVISASEWALMKTYANIFNKPQDMVTFVALEWTPNEYKYDFGHKNIYFRDEDGPAIRSTEENGYNPDRLFNSLKGKKALAFPHHPSADWGMVSAATDWAYYNEEHQRLVEIFSRHAAFEYFKYESKYAKNIPQMPNHSVVDALNRGYRLGFTAGSDSHQMEHGIEGGIVAVYSEDLTRESIFDSLYDRRTFATTGARILMEFSINDSPMGSELTVGEEDKVKIKIRVLGTNNIEELRVVKNGTTFKSVSPNNEKVELELEDVVDKKTAWYYVAVKQVDDHRAWASPIWVDYKGE